jgi:hypothetical protein
MKLRDLGGAPQGRPRHDHRRPGACADCLVPENLMRGILGQALGVPDDTIDLTYPSTPS